MELGLHWDEYETCSETKMRNDQDETGVRPVLDPRLKKSENNAGEQKLLNQI